MVGKRRHFDEDPDTDTQGNRKRFKNLETHFKDLQLASLASVHDVNVPSTSGDGDPGGNYGLGSSGSSNSFNLQPGKPVTLALRYPNGHRQRVDLCVRSKVEEIFASMASSSGVAPNTVVLVLQYPRRELSIDDAHRSLQDVGIVANEIVFVEEK